MVLDGRLWHTAPISESRTGGVGCRRRPNADPWVAFRRTV